MKRYQLCCDMDGVLCDFATGALKLVNQTLAEKDKYKNTNPELYDTIIKALNENLILSIRVPLLDVYVN